MFKFLLGLVIIALVGSAAEAAFTMIANGRLFLGFFLICDAFILIWVLRYFWKVATRGERKNI